MRAKMVVREVHQFQGSENLRLVAVGPKEAYPADGTDENNTFAKWTPTAELTITINNPNLLGQFKPDQEFYLDFTEATGK